MPVQIIFSGKAHPKDTPGKELLRELVHLSQREEFRKRIVFLEDYDMVIAGTWCRASTSGSIRREGCTRPRARAA